MEKFFSVRYRARAIITPFRDGETIPSGEDFLREIPELFNIASPCAPSDLVRFRRMSMVPGDTGRLAAFLLMQAERINGLTRYIVDEASKDANGTAAYAIGMAEEPGEQEKSLLPENREQHTFFRFIIIRDQDRAALLEAVAGIERKSLRERKAASKKNTE